MAIAWAVLTVSSEPQIGSLQNQRTWAEGLAADKGWKLTRVIEGVSSGRAGPRAICRDLLLEIRATPLEARPEHVLMIRLDRVGRGSIIDSQIFVRDLRALGARLFTRDSGEIKLDSAMDELIAAVQLAVARHENDVRSEKIRAILKRRQAAGEPLSNAAPYGLYIELKPHRHYVAYPTHVEVLQRLFAMRVAGERQVDIARFMRQNAPPCIYKNGNYFHLNWSYAAMKRTISHRAYIGTVVDETTWLRAQMLSKYVGKAPPRVRVHGKFVLSYMLRCECGRTLSGVARNIERTARLGREPDRYYECQATWNHGEKILRHKAATIDSRFETLLRSLMEHPEKHLKVRSFTGYGITLTTVDRDLEKLRKRLDRIEQARARVWRLDDAGLIDSVEVARRLDDLKSQGANVQAQLVKKLQQRTLCLASQQDIVDTRELCQHASSDYEKGDFNRRVEIARSIIASLGGLRVTTAGNFVAGIGRDATPQEKLKRRDPSCWINRPRYRGQFVKTTFRPELSSYTNDSRVAQLRRASNALRESPRDEAAGARLDQP